MHVLIFWASSVPLVREGAGNRKLTREQAACSVVAPEGERWVYTFRCRVLCEACVSA